MPELAEVERGRRLFENAILNKTIVAVSTQEDARVFVGDSANVLEKSLPGRKVEAVKRLGKNVYLIVDGSGPTLAFHLGNGEFHYRRARYIKRVGSEWPPWRWKILLKLDDGTEVCTIDTSRFGRIRAIDAKDPVTVPPLSLLGPDAWLSLPNHDELRAELICRTAPIKTVLLDQNAAVSGLGNYNTDEVLFQARIHPRQPAYTLTEQQTLALHAAIQLVAKTVMDLDADTKKFPKTWLYKHRYGRKSGVGQVFKMVTHDRINGRITAMTDVQVLDDYSAVPLPSRRKRTLVEAEGDEDDDGKNETGSVRTERAGAKRPAERKTKTSRARGKVEKVKYGRAVSNAKRPRKRTDSVMESVSPAHGEEMAVSRNIPSLRTSTRLREKRMKMGG